MEATTNGDYYSEANMTISSGAGDDTIFGGDDTIYGDNFNANSTEKNPAEDIGRGDDDTIYGNDGDDIWGASNAETGGYWDQYLFVFRTGDGVDTINDFQVGKDQLVISGYEEQDLVIFEDNEGNTIITFGDDSTDAIRLMGVAKDGFIGLRGEKIVDYDADTGAGDPTEVDNGILNADEIIGLRDDLFSDDNGAPSSTEAGIVLVSPMERLDDSGDEPDVII